MMPCSSLLKVGSWSLLLLQSTALVTTALLWIHSPTVSAGTPSKRAVVKLPQPVTTGGESLEEAIAGRRTVRNFTGKPVTVQQLSQLLWAAQGETDSREHRRAAPSAGALYPLELYVAVGAPLSPKLNPGIYHYLPESHALEFVTEGDQRVEIAKAALNQNWMDDAAFIFLIAADFSRTTAKYAQRGFQYVHQEAGCAAENLLLQAKVLGLHAAIVGAFGDLEMNRAYRLQTTMQPLILLPVGR